MKVGVSTSCLYPMPIEQALDELGGKGVHNLELYMCSFSECEKSFLKKIEQICNVHSTKIVSVHPFTSAFEGLMFFSDYERRFADGVEMYKHFADAANFLGADIIAFHGTSKYMPVEQGRYFERFDKLRRIMLSEGIRLCQENVSHAQSYSTEFIGEMIKNIPDTNFILDTKQAVRAGISPDEMLVAMGENITHVHISDNNENDACLPIGAGNFDVESFMRRTKEFNNEVSVILELYRNNFENPEELRKSYSLLQNYL